MVTDIPDGPVSTCKVGLRFPGRMDLPDTPNGSAY